MVRILVMNKDNSGELFSGDTKKKHQKARETVEQYFPNIIKKAYVLNPPKMLLIMFKALSWTMGKKKRERFCPLGSDAAKILDKEIGLDRLPACVGGTNSTPVDKYDNFWDEEMKKSFAENRLGPKN